MSAAKVELGRRLFYDRRLSGNRTFSCASCHQQSRAFTDGRPRALGATGEEHPRGAMTLANVAYNLRFNWGDPRTKSLEEQMLVPMLGRHPVELGLAGKKELVLRLREDPDYRERFAEAFRGRRSLTFRNVTRAIAAFQRTLISGDSAYDRRVFADDRGAMSAAAERGMRLFHSDRLRCDECHGGFNFSGPVTFVGAARLEPEFHNTGLFALDGAGGYPEPNRGVFEHTRRPVDMGRFRAPTLRNVELTAPYLHDGGLSTLEEVIDFYAAGGRGAGRRSPLKSDKVSGFEISAEEKADVVEFLKSLTDHKFVTDPRFSNPFPP